MLPLAPAGTSRRWGPWEGSREDSKAGSCPSLSQLSTGHISHAQVVRTLPEGTVLRLEALLGQGAVAGHGQGGFAFLKSSFSNYFHEQECFYGAALRMYPLPMAGFSGLFLEELMSVFNCHTFS